jgi:hypothetical protein
MDARRAAPAAVAHAAAAITGALLLCAVGQPIFTDDLWWHLALGRAFAAHGPWLAEDPLLFAAAGPPAPASWLADVALAGVASAGGFYALRALHVAIVAAILALVWSEFLRAGRSRALASVGALAFASLAAYRLAQLRPDLVSIALCLGAWRFLVADERPPSWRRVALAALAAALWANLHAAFPLGPLLVGGAAAGAFLAGDRARAARLAATCAIAGVATLANPTGIHAHLAYLSAGVQTPALERIADEWTHVNLFALPAPPLPPSPLAWALAWAIVLGTAFAVLRGSRGRAFDLARLGAALVALALSLTAVRFLWLGVFPLLFLAHALGARVDGVRAAARVRWIPAAASLALSGAFFALGDWPAITRGLPTTAVGYAKPYPVIKYYAHAIWLIADSGLRGDLYNDYFLGGFAGYWLAPQVRTLINGTLNVPKETLDALQAIAQRRGLRPGEDLSALLDRLDVDLFLGIRLPDAGLPGRRWAATTAYLEGTPGWIPIFRNAESAVYLRANERNRDNLERIADYYEAQRVPFDRARGFEIEKVIREAPEWAFVHGAIPRRFPELAERAESPGPADPRIRDRVAALYAVLGCYEQAAAIDRAILRDAPDAVRSRRRLVWALLHSGADAEARSEAAALAARPSSDGLSHAIADVARQAASLAPADRAALVARLPLLGHDEVGWLTQGIPQPDPRPALH